MLLCRIELFGVAVLNLDEYGRPDMATPSETARPEHTCSPVKVNKYAQFGHDLGNLGQDSKFLAKIRNSWPRFEILGQDSGFLVKILPKILFNTSKIFTQKRSWVKDARCKILAMILPPCPTL